MNFMSKIIEVQEACRPETPGLHSKLFKKEELNRAETIAATLNGLDIYSAQELLEKMKTYLLLTVFTSSTD